MESADLLRNMPTKTIPSNFAAFIPTSFTYLPLSTQAILLFTGLVLLAIVACDFLWPKDETYGLPVFEIGNDVDCRTAVAEGDRQVSMKQSFVVCRRVILTVCEYLVSKLSIYPQDTRKICHPAEFGHPQVWIYARGPDFSNEGCIQACFGPIYRFRHSIARDVYCHQN